MSANLAKATVCGTLVGLAMLIHTPAIADGLDWRATPVSGAPDAVYSYAIVGGIDASKHETEGYLGTIVAFNRDLDRDGFLLRSFGTLGRYTDVGLNFSDVNDRYLQGDIMLGYQLVRDGITVAGYIGADFQRHKLSRNDVGVVLQGSETGFKAVLDIETDRHTSSAVYFALNSAYSTAFDTYAVVGRLGYNFGRIAIGPEAMLLGDASGDAQRLGAFALTDISLGGATIGTLSASVGYQFVDDPSRYGTSFGEPGVYGTLQFTIAFGTAQHKPYK